MSDGLPKVLPNTGAAGLLGLGIWQQMWLLLAVAAIVVGLALIIKSFWRKGKSLNG